MEHRQFLSFKYRTEFNGTGGEPKPVFTERTLELQATNLSSPNKMSRADNVLYRVEIAFQQKGYEDSEGQILCHHHHVHVPDDIKAAIIHFSSVYLIHTIVALWFGKKKKKKDRWVRADLLTGYGWTTVNMMDSLQLLKREESESESQQNHQKKKTTITANNSVR